MATTHIQGAVGSIASGTTFNVALPGAPTKGNLVCAGLIGSTGVNTGLTIKDGNGNVYNITPNSPSPVAGGNSVWVAWWIAASVPSATVTLAWTGGGASAECWVDEFSFSGNCKFDSDVAAANTGTAGTTVNTPTITPTFAGSLLYSCATVTGIISAPAAGATLGAWTGAAGAITNGNMSEYILSQAASNRAVQYTCSSSQWSSMVMAFMIDQPGHIQLEGGTGNIKLENASGDIALET